MMRFAKVSIVATALLAGILSGCGSSQTTEAPNQDQQASASADNSQAAKTAAGTVTTVGSTALQPLVEQAAQQFMSENAGVTIQVQGGGSGTGLSQAASGGADIGNSDIFAEEKSGIQADQLVDHKVAVVGMAAVVNKNNKVDNLTKQQLIDIFTGKVKNWKEVGGADEKITLVNRPDSSGTRATFYTFALDKHKEAEGITQDSSGTVRKIIGDTPGAIGYLALSYLDGSVKSVKLDGVEPSVENIETNKYPVWAYEHMYTKGEPKGAVKSFLDFMVSDEIQKDVVSGAKYIPVSEMKVDRDAAGTVKNK